MYAGAPLNTGARMTSFRPLVISCCACALAALAVAKTETQAPARASAASRLIGTWALVSYESSDAESQQYRGPKPIGLLYYDRTGHMAVDSSRSPETAVYRSAGWCVHRPAADARRGA